MRWRTGLSSIMCGEWCERPAILAGRPPAQGIAMAPAARQHAAVLQVHPGIPGVQRFDRGNLVQIDDVAAVDARETGRIQVGLDPGDGAAQRVVVAAHPQVDVVAGRLQPFDVVGGNEELAAKLAYQEALRALGSRRWRLVVRRSEEHTSELQSLMRISYAVFCLKKKKRMTHRIQQPQQNKTTTHTNNTTL